MKTHSGANERRAPNSRTAQVPDPLGLGENKWGLGEGVGMEGEISRRRRHKITNPAQKARHSDLKPRLKER